MEAQVENNVKTKKRKKNTYVQISITEKLLKWRKIILERKNLLSTGAPGLTPRSCGISCRQKSYCRQKSNITCNM